MMLDEKDLNDAIKDTRRALASLMVVHSLMDTGRQMKLGYAIEKMSEIPGYLESVKRTLEYEKKG